MVLLDAISIYLQKCQLYQQVSPTFNKSNVSGIKQHVIFWNNCCYVFKMQFKIKLQYGMF